MSERKRVFRCSLILLLLFLASACAIQRPAEPEIGYREVGEREAVARPLPALVHSDRDVATIGLPPLTFGGLSGGERDSEECFPESPRPFGVVGWELDQEWSRHVPTLLGRS